MNKLSIFTLSSIAMAFAPAANAVDIGFGASLKSNKSTIYIPIKVAGWIIEPSLQYYKSESSNDSPSTNAYSSSNYTSSTSDPAISSSTGTGTWTSKSSNESIDLGVGIFKESIFEKGFSAYYGARLGYTEDEYTSKINKQLLYIRSIY